MKRKGGSRGGGLFVRDLHNLLSRPPSPLRSVVAIPVRPHRAVGSAMPITAPIMVPVEATRVTTTGGAGHRSGRHNSRIDDPPPGGDRPLGGFTSAGGAKWRHDQSGQCEPGCRPRSSAAASPVAA